MSDTGLVGRRGELAEVAGRLARYRLVTVTGVGGVGKTRLARHAVAEVRPRFPDGVWWVELSPLVDGAMLTYAIAEALPLVDQSTRPMLDVVAEYLAGCELLLVLDTCEHLVRECAEAVAALLMVAPGLRVLAASRRPLGLSVEDVVPLCPLPEADALALLARRAGGAAHGRADGGESAALCRRLEGLPLAIELAAARLGEMTPGELNRRLEDRFEVLGESRQPVYAADPPWHQALRTAIGWSHQLCTPAQRLAWARLSVFAGSFDREAARRVCADDRLPVQDVSGLLTSLVQSSIVEWVPEGSESRYRMLDTIREFGAFWLRGLGEEQRVRRRHLDHYLALARTADAAWFGPEQADWYRRTNSEHANFRAALDFCLTEGDGQGALELSGALWFVWFACGFATEGRHYLDRALAMDGAAGRVRDKALWARCLVAITQGDWETARRCATAFKEVTAGDDDTTVSQAAAFLSGAILGGDGRHTEAIETHTAAPDARTASGRYGSAWGLIRLSRAFSHVFLGQFDQARAVSTELRADCAEHGEIWLRAFGDYTLALAALFGGRPDEAAAHARAATGGKRQFQDSVGIALCLDLLASAAVASGDAERAARLLGTADRLWQAVGSARIGSEDFATARAACETEARSALGDDAYGAAFDAGYEDDLDAVVADVLTV
ncbi:ATP-binding protein [Streptomyces sp. NRRL B-1347]|uniref:ATP-binding protein n=1 Tax=Streptomyces sp. NRRL B-1347 TaxID=1476877 RepID=UPI000561EE8A|nr:NB-ARC domain-containing protein [Streptomyces sp. NRRL B-1347]